MIFTACPLPDLDPDGNDGDLPVADFTVDKNMILPTGIVQFTDLSTGNPTGWWWQFGDGGTSILQNPTHQFDEFGVYDVSLMVTNSNGSDEITITDCIKVQVEIGPTGTVTDAEGNTYKTVKIGPQWWMAENLRVTKYESGGAVQYIGNNEDWLELEIDNKAMSYYDFNIANGQAKGALYTHAAATNGKISTVSGPQFVQGVCPTGWHLPDDQEWQQLEINLGMSVIQADQYGYRGTNQGSKMAGGNTQWISGELSSNPEFGATGLEMRPYGYISGSGASLFLGEAVFFWTATSYGNGTGDNAWARRLLFDFAGVYREFSDKTTGMYVRCVKDQ